MSVLMFMRCAGKIAYSSAPGALTPVRADCVAQATRDFTVKTVQKAVDTAVKVGSRLYTDSASSYRALTGYVCEYVKHTKKEHMRGEVRGMSTGPNACVRCSSPVCEYVVGSASDSTRRSGLLPMPAEHPSAACVRAGSIERSPLAT